MLNVNNTSDTDVWDSPDIAGKEVKEILGELAQAGVIVLEDIEIEEIEDE